MDMDTYTIEKGKHRSGLYLHPHYGKSGFRYTVRFGGNCVYDLGNADQADINKLCGVSFGLHHNNSARFGWACVGGRIELFAYCYANKKRVWKSMGLVDTGVDYELHLFVKKNAYHFWAYVKDEPARFVSVEKPETCEWGYLLYPYFGGNRTAPHDMTIGLKRTVIL